jgi:hypothetical protein
MNKLHKKILSLGLVYFTTAASYATAPDWPLGGTFGGAPFPPPVPQLPQLRRHWAPEEDQQLYDLRTQHRTSKWEEIASCMPGRTAQQCRDRWHYFLKGNPPGTHLAHTKFTPEEDQQLRDLVGKHGTGDWQLIASSMPGRGPRQCKDRWINYLAPGLNLSPWTSEEDILLLQKFDELGTRWVQIAQFFPGKTDVNCKNRQKFLQKHKATQQQQQLAQPPLLPLPIQQLTQPSVQLPLLESPYTPTFFNPESFLKHMSRRPFICLDNLLLPSISNSVTTTKQRLVQPPLLPLPIQQLTQPSVQLPLLESPYTPTFPDPKSFLKHMSRRPFICLDDHLLPSISNPVTTTKSHQ